MKTVRFRNGDGSKPWYLVNPKIAGKWMFIPLKMVLIGIDPYPRLHMLRQKSSSLDPWPCPFFSPPDCATAVRHSDSTSSGV